MKIYITTHGDYENNSVTLCTIDFDLAIKHFLDYYNKDKYWNSMGEIQVWENNSLLFDYGSMSYDIINQKRDLSYNEIKEDFLEQFRERGYDYEKI